MRYVEEFCAAEEATDDNMAQAHCMLDIEVYKHTLRLWNTYCISTATVVTRTHLIHVALNEHYLSCLV